MIKIEIQFHDVKEKLPLEEMEGESVIRDYLVLGTWDGGERAKTVSYDAKHKRWVWPMRHSMEWPDAALIRFWAERPAVQKHQLEQHGKPRTR